jgi:hypothetical protein
LARHFDVGRTIKQAVAKPLAVVGRCRREMEELEAGYHQHLHDIVAGAYAAVWYVRKRLGE